MTRRMQIGCLVLSGTVFSSQCLALEGSRTAHCGAIDQVYLYQTPDQTPNQNQASNQAPEQRLTGASAGMTAAGLTGDTLIPAVMLLHGAGDRPANMIDAWKHFAKKQRIILLAPDLPRELKYEQAAPKIFRCLAEDARAAMAIDPQRVYLFGNSMGGYLAYDAMMFESDYFAATAVHGMKIADDYRWIVTKAKRKMPVAIYIGDHDQFHTQASVRQTRDLLRTAGFEVHYVEMEHHDHNYYERSDEINADAWKFMQKYSLPAR